MVLYLALALVPLSAAWEIGWAPPALLLWGLTAFFVLGALANGASRSKAERADWATGHRRAGGVLPGTRAGGLTSFVHSLHTRRQGLAASA